MMKGEAIIYSQSELDWIEKNKAMVRREAHAEFCKKFKRNDVSLTNYTALCKRKGWLTGRTGQYAKGNVPENKGKKMPFNANSARHRFKKGYLGGAAKEKYKPIGTERFSKGGYLERKIHDGLPRQSRWRAVHIVNWEAIHGSVKDGHALKCLDGNRQNCDPENWEAIPRGMLPRLAGSWCVGYDDAPEELKPIIIAAAKLKYETNKRGKRS